MLETLNEYISQHKIQKLQSLEELTALIGGPDIQYYVACYTIAEVMLLRKKDKRRCVIFHGAVDSGKSWIAKIMNRIFISYSKRQQKGMFDERISELETNVQLVIQNEVPMKKIFTLKNMPDIKLYTEGDGIQVENKYGHPFTGFVNTH